MDKIFISGIDCVAAIGVTTEERTIRQRLSIDVEFAVDNVRAAQADSIKETINYSTVAGTVSLVCGSRDFHLIETVAEKIAASLLAEFPTPEVRVLVRKHSPVLEPRVNYVSVEIVRKR
jgi:7,8-dihydroneopterin aldolase/epimerase/oxygenase